MSSKLRIIVAVALMFGSTSIVLSASNSRTEHHKHGYAMRYVAPQNWSRLGFTDPECGFAGIKDYGPNGYQSC